MAILRFELNMYRVGPSLVAFVPGSALERAALDKPTAYTKLVGPLTVNRPPHFVPATYAVFMTPVTREFFGVLNGTFSEAQASRDYDRFGYCFVYRN